MHQRFGVEVFDIKLSNITADSGYSEIRDLFERYSLLLFREQKLDDGEHIALGKLFGPIEDRSRVTNNFDPVVTTVSNVAEDGQVIEENDLKVSYLKANQLWHTDSTFLSTPALANILTAKVVPSTGGETEFVSTRVAWKDLPSKLKVRIRDKVFCHRYLHSRQQISKSLAIVSLFMKHNDQFWRALWPNPCNGEEALYIASHIYAVQDMNVNDGSALVDRLIEFSTQSQYIHTHKWRVGDVLIWDERATMHRGRPWSYDEARILSSICVTARDVDGLDLVRSL
ncbi:MAG: TauD/TfdA family dioxygenase [Arenicellales bacterium]